MGPISMVRPQGQTERAAVREEEERIKGEIEEETHGKNVRGIYMLSYDL